jgi:hypothetical protein
LLTYFQMLAAPLEQADPAVFNIIVKVSFGL